MLISELVRVRRDFEQHASRYTDETLTIHFLEAGVEPPRGEFRKPNHTIPLWQYMGKLATEDDIQRVLRSSRTKFGLTGADLSAFAVIEGPETELFQRIGIRAGSIVPAEVRTTVAASMCSQWSATPGGGKPVFVANPNSLAVWLNVVLTCVANFQPERFRGSSLVVDPFAASIPACEYLIQYSSAAASASGRTVDSALTQARFHVALSFPGEKREFVLEVAEGLRSAGVRVFYDGYFEADLARPDLDVLLQRIYHDQSDLIVVFLCREYEEKQWCGLEWRAVRDLIKKRRGDSIMPLRFDDTDIPGLFSIDGYVDLRNRTPANAVQLIRQRLSRLKPTT